MTLILMTIAAEIGQRETEILQGHCRLYVKIIYFFFSIFLCTVCHVKPLQEHRVG